MASGNRKRTPELYAAAIEAFRVLGYRPGSVANAIGMHRNSVARLWEFGWADKDPLRYPPIKDVVQHDTTLVRAFRGLPELEAATNEAKESLEAIEAARLALKRDEQFAWGEVDKAKAEAKRIRDEAEEYTKAAMQRAEAESKRRLAELLQRAKVDSAETLADEANAAKFGRKAALSAVVMAALLMKDANRFASEVGEALQAHGGIAKMHPREGMRLLNDMVHLAETAEKTQILALQAERLRLGQPTDVLGITAVDATLEEKEIKARAVQRALAKMRAKLTPGTDGPVLVAVPPEGPARVG